MGNINIIIWILKKKQLISFIIADKEIDISALKENLEAKLPRYMLPNKIIQLDEMPLTPNGKIDRNLLKEKGNKNG